MRFKTTRFKPGAALARIKMRSSSGALIGEAEWWHDEQHAMLNIEYLCIYRRYRKDPENAVALYQKLGQIAKEIGAKYVTGEVTWKGALAAGVFALGQPEYVGDDIREYTWREAFKILPNESPEESDCGPLENIQIKMFVRTRVRAFEDSEKR